MRMLSLLTIAICLACGTSPQKPNMETKQSADASASISEPSLNIDEDQAQQMIERASVAADIEVIEPGAAPDAAQNPAPIEESQDFMSASESGIFLAFSSAQNRKGQKLSPEKAQALTTAIMGVLQATKDGKPFAMAGKWNEFAKLVKQMNKEAQATDPAGLVQDIIDLAQDILDLVPDLVQAVLDLDVAGVIDVALDLIDLLIDFLV